MKKQILLFFLMFTSFFSFNQTIIFQELFTDTTGISPNWLNIDHDGDGIKWKWRENNAGENYAYSESWADDEILTPDNYLITPLIDLIGLTGTVNLRFVVGAADDEYFEDHYRLAVSTDTSIASFTTTLLEETTGEDAWFGWPQRNIDLTSYIGKKIYLAWEHYDCSDQYRFLLDSIVVTNSPISAIANTPLSEVKVYPNPTKDFLTIQGELENAKAELFSSDGRTVFMTENINGEINVDVSTFKKGFYILRLESQENIIFRKINILE